MAAKSRLYSVLLARSRPGGARQLGLESLESRIALSALSLAPNAFAAKPPRAESRSVLAALAKTAEPPEALAAQAARESIARHAIGAVATNTPRVAFEAALGLAVARTAEEQTAPPRPQTAFKGGFVNWDILAVEQGLPAVVRLKVDAVSPQTFTPDAEAKTREVPGALAPPGTARNAFGVRAGPGLLAYGVGGPGEGGFLAFGDGASEPRFPFGGQFPLLPELARLATARSLAAANNSLAEPLRIAPATASNADLQQPTPPGASLSAANGTAASTSDELFRAPDWSVGGGALARPRSASASEGGLIELEVVPEISPGRTARQRGVGLSAPLAADVLPTALDDAWASDSHGFRVEEEPQLAGGSVSQPARTLNNPEGGMVELAAVSVSLFVDAQAVSAAAANPRSTLLVEEIRMDNPVRQFRAFELATTTPGEGLLPDAAASHAPTAPPGTPPAIRPHAAEPLVERAGVVPLALAGLLVAAVDRVYRDDAPPAWKTGGRPECDIGTLRSS